MKRVIQGYVFSNDARGQGDVPADAVGNRLLLERLVRGATPEMNF
jgi:hypothetical protein